MKTIQMTIEDELLTSVDQVISELSVSRSAFIREALQMALSHYHIRKMEQQQAAGYASQPVQSGEFDGWQAIQDWGDGETQWSTLVHTSST